MAGAPPFCAIIARGRSHKRGRSVARHDLTNAKPAQVPNTRKGGRASEATRPPCALTDLPPSPPTSRRVQPEHPKATDHIDHPRRASKAAVSLWRRHPTLIALRPARRASITARFNVPQTESRVRSSHLRQRGARPPSRVGRSRRTRVTATPSSSPHRRSSAPATCSRARS